MRTRSRAFHCHGGCTSTSIRLPTLGLFFHKLWWLDPPAGPRHVVFCCNGVPFRRWWSSVPETLGHRLAFTGVLMGTDWSCAASMLAFRSLGLFALQRHAVVTLSGERKDLRFNTTISQSQKPTEDPPHTPKSTSEIRSTDGTEAVTHTLSSHQCSLSSSDKSTTSSSKPFSKKSLHLILEGKSKQIRLQTTATLSLSPSNSLFPLFTCLYFSLLVHVLHCFGFTFCVLFQPTTEKTVVVDGPVLTEYMFFHFGSRSSVFQHSLFGDVSTSFFCATKLPTANKIPPVASCTLSVVTLLFFALRLLVLSRFCLAPLLLQV